jgi:tetratricopeptide (TPR) repeat protein
MQDNEKSVFISYRRENSSFAARAIFMDLHQHSYDVFMDVQNIDSGDFERIILNQIAARAHFVLVLAPGSLDRTVDPGDWLRREIEHAIKLQRNVVPVFVNGFSFTDKKSNLYSGLANLPNYNGLTVPNDYFEEAMQRLRERFLKQPLYGVVVPTPPVDREAVAAKIKAATNQPEPTTQQLNAEQHYSHAASLADQGNYVAAIEELNHAIALRPDYPEAYNNRGVYHKMQGNYRKAIADYTRSLDLDNPEPYKPYNSRGIARTKLDDWKGAIDDFSSALRANPRYGYSLSWRAVAYEHLGNFDAAIADYEAYLALDGDISPRQATPEQLRQIIVKLKAKQSKSRRKFGLW